MHIYWQTLAGDSKRLIAKNASSSLKPLWKGEWIAYVSESHSKKRFDRSDNQEEHYIHLYSIRTEQTIPIALGKEAVQAFTWSHMTTRLYFATRTPWTSEAEEAYKKMWNDVIQYREEERGATLYRIDIINMTAYNIEIVANISLRVEKMICSSDGRQLIFSTVPRSDRMESMDDYEIYSIDLTNYSFSVPLRLTYNQAYETDLEWSSDGSVFFTVTENGSVDDVYKDTQGRLYSLSAANNRIERWADNFKGNIKEFALLDDGRNGAIILGQLGTEIQIYTQKSVHAELIKQTGWNGTYESIRVVSNGNHSTIAFIYSSFDLPQEVYFIHDIDRLTEAQAITRENKLFTERNLPKGTIYRWLNEDDRTEVEGVLLYPPEKYQEKNLPLLVLIHGGPYDADLNGFRADWYYCATMMATEGWLVLQPNYRGSTVCNVYNLSGYGDEFLDGVRIQMLSRPGKDILFGVDALVRDGIADPTRLTIGGYSYGGYLTNWLITQTTRFNAALSGAGAVENVADWGVNDLPIMNAYTLGGLPWEQPNHYHDEAAIYHMDKVCTPTHIVVGEDDIRVPAVENYILERALSVVGVPTKLIIFPGESHVIQDNPWHEKIKVREEINWLHKYGNIRPSACNRTVVSNANIEYVRQRTSNFVLSLFVTASCETGIYESGTTLTGDFTMIYSGLPKLNKTRSAHGVTICLDETVTDIWKTSGSEWEAVNERIVKIRMYCAPINVTYIAVYAPVNSYNKSMADKCDQFYLQLQETIDKVPKEDMIVLMGDFNARVGKQEHLTMPQIVGPHAVDVKNENGIRLIDFCLTNNIVISNTFFQHKSSIEDVRVYRRAAGSIGTDHHLMRSKVKLHLISRRKKTQQKHLQLDRSKLQDDNIIENFQTDLKKSFEDVKSDGVNINVKYFTFVQHIKEAAETYFKFDNSDNSKRKEWLTDDILRAVEKKSSAYLIWQSYCGTSEEKKYKRKYVSCRNLVKSLVNKRQIDYWDELSKIETAIINRDPATAYTMIRRLKGGKQNVENSPIQDKNGKLLTNSRDQLDRWREYFSELLNVNSVVDPHVIDHISIPVIPTAEQERQNEPPTLEEISQALKQMKNRKAPSNDDISTDILKAGELPVLKWLHEIFVDIWQNEEIVDDWILAILIRLFKNKGDKKQCDNYRGISLLVVASKLFTRVILNRIQKLIDKQLLEQQACFRSNRSTIDQIFILKMTMEKSREFNRPLYMCFIDIQKAYESVNRELLWKICQHYGLTDKVVRLIKLIYKNTGAKVRINGELCESFNIETGVVQEEASLTDIKLAHGSNDFYHSGREKYEEFDILTLIYADDLIVMCNTINDLEKFILVFEKVTQQHGLIMSVKKTCIMSLQQFKQDINGKISKNQEVDQLDVDIIIRNHKIEITDSFCYLGCLLSRDQHLDKEIEVRLTKATAAFNMLKSAIWCRKTFSVNAKLRIFQACILPVLLYGSEV
ncbi:unnamed protein product [Rotaria sp. Silwood2]|nr:unnamed protein product [Rotaria sp. Silwood2]